MSTGSWVRAAYQRGPFLSPLLTVDTGHSTTQVVAANLRVGTLCHCQSEETIWYANHPTSGVRLDGALGTLHSLHALAWALWPFLSSENVLGAKIL